MPYLEITFPLFSSTWVVWCWKPSGRKRGVRGGCDSEVPSSVSVGVIGCKGVQVPHLAQATLDVCNVDFYIILKATEEETRLTASFHDVKKTAECERPSS